jgi:molybdopterin-guanine dinucleotide biosynthesis protein A
MIAELKNISAAILAGGNASRLGGIAKGAIEVCSGVCIIERLIKELYAADINDIVIVANDSRPYRNCGVKIIPDIRTGCGPIGGVEAALVHFEGRCDAVMFVPCDMPNISYKELLALKEAFIETHKPVVFAKTTEFFWHPLCAVVHIGLKSTISAAIDSGQRTFRDLWYQMNAESVLFSGTEAFVNINDFADMENWQLALRRVVKVLK